MYKPTINSILRIAILGVVLLTISGCSIGPVYIDPLHSLRSSKTNKQSKSDDIYLKKDEKIKLFNQEFDMPEPAVVMAKLYP